MDDFKALTRGISFKKGFRHVNKPSSGFEKLKGISQGNAVKSSKTVDELFGALDGWRKPARAGQITCQTEEDLNDDFDMNEDANLFGQTEEILPAASQEEAADDFESDGDEDSDMEEPSKIQLYSGAELAESFAPKQKRKRKKKKKDAAKLALMKREEVNRFRNQHNIHVHGTDVYEPVSAFEELTVQFQLDSRLITNIRGMGYQLPTPIQMQAIPILLDKRNILASAPTGSGKTAAFVIPMLHALGGPEDVGYRAVIVSPTRELAKQTFFEIERLGEGMGFRVHLLEDVPKVIKKFRAKSNLALRFDVLVTTPNRLVYLLNAKPPTVSLKEVEWLVIDESDKLFEAFAEGGFRDQLAIIYKACSKPSVRRALFSATFATEVEDWCKLNLDNVIGISIGARNSATATIDQKLVFVGNEVGKITALRQIFQNDYVPPVLIFVQTKQKAKELYRELMNDGSSHVDVIHSDRDQKERDEVVSNFRAGKVWTLIATEVLGRGIDFKGVNLVINYDFPLSSISYIHRIGRTGRAGQRGQAITLFTEKDAPNLRSIASVMQRSGCEVPEFMLQLSPSSGSGLKRLKKSAADRKKQKSERDSGVVAKPIVKKKRPIHLLGKGQQKRLAKNGKHKKVNKKKP